jgi:hypothetical protein
MPKKLALEAAPEKERSHRAQQEAAADEPQAFANDQLEDRASLLPRAMRMPISFRRWTTR